jgi:hypothetical protein
MMRDFEEDITTYFNDGLMRVSNGGPLKLPIKLINIKRNKKLDLILTAVSDGRIADGVSGYRAGTVRQAEEIIEFQHAGGAVGVARGVIYQGDRSQSSLGKSPETTQTCSLQFLELDLKSDREATYIVEWVDNVSDGFVWTDIVNNRKVETLTKEIGSGEGKITLSREHKGGGGSKALHLKVDGLDLYLLSSDRRKKGRKGGDRSSIAGHRHRRSEIKYEIASRSCWDSL